MNPKKACLFIYSDSIGLNNYPFSLSAEGVGFKNLLYSYVYMKKIFAEYGIDLSTRDINPPEDSQIVICLDNPHLLRAEKKNGQLWCLIINDPPMYTPESWDKRYHDKFDLVFTFDETMVDGKKYIYYPFAIDTEYFTVPALISKDDFLKRRLATFVSHAIHKLNDGKQGSTIHLRYNTIKWYGRHHPDDFRFFGGTFLKRNYYFSFRGIGLLKRLLPAVLFRKLAKMVQKDLVRVFGGELGPLEKFKVIRDFRFYYCYENTIGINGYVCEKIFDCFYCGVVPVYWGAPNIHELIPYKCFIDGTAFRSEVELFEFLHNMSFEEYTAYQTEAIRFLQSEEMKRFTVAHSVNCIFEPIKNAKGLGKTRP